MPLQTHLSSENSGALIFYISWAWHKIAELPHRIGSKIKNLLGHLRDPVVFLYVIGSLAVLGLAVEFVLQRIPDFPDRANFTTLDSLSNITNEYLALTLRDTENSDRLATLYEDVVKFGAIAENSFWGCEYTGWGPNGTCSKECSTQGQSAETPIAKEVHDITVNIPDIISIVFCARHTALDQIHGHLTRLLDHQKNLPYYPDSGLQKQLTHSYKEFLVNFYGFLEKISPDVANLATTTKQFAEILPPFQNVQFKRYVEEFENRCSWKSWGIFGLAAVKIRGFTRKRNDFLEGARKNAEKVARELEFTQLGLETILSSKSYDTWNSWIGGHKIKDLEADIAVVEEVRRKAGCQMLKIAKDYENKKHLLKASARENLYGGEDRVFKIEEGDYSC